MIGAKLPEGLESDLWALQWQMQAFDDDWVRLKNTDPSFHLPPHGEDPVKALYRSGRENVGYLAIALKWTIYDTSKQIRARIRSALDCMDTCDHAALARAGIAANPSLATSNAEEMIRLYERQQPVIAEVEELCRILEADALQPSSRGRLCGKQPLDVVLDHVHYLEADVRVHRKADERALSGILVQGLKHAGFDADGEAHIYLGHSDAAVKIEGRHRFVAECKFWEGAAALQDAFAQVLRYCTAATELAVVVVYSRNRDFDGVLSAAAAAAHKVCIPPVEVLENGTHLSAQLRRTQGSPLRVSVVIANLYFPGL